MPRCANQLNIVKKGKRNEERGWGYLREREVGEGRKGGKGARGGERGQKSSGEGIPLSQDE